MTSAHAQHDGGRRRPRGIPFGAGTALLAGAMFGATTPAAKVLLGDANAFQLAGLLYLGSGAGLGVLLMLRKARGAGTGPRDTRASTGLGRGEIGWLAAATLVGGVVAPVLLLLGLSTTPGSDASLLLNLEGVFSALLAWLVFGESVDRRVGTGFALIVAGGVVLSWPGSGSLAPSFGALLIAGACLGWALDNNLTQKISGADPLTIAAAKGAVAGAVNLAIAGAAGGTWPAAGTMVAAGLLGVAGYGLSLALFVTALRHVGTARTSAYFSIAPFVGAALSVAVLREPLEPSFAVAAVLMAAGVALHVTEHHVHEHRHEPLVHAHPHVHDEHHRHDHREAVDALKPHAHEHAHAKLIHAHPHFPDLHHRHRH